MGKELQQTTSQGTHTDSQHIHEKTLSITKHQGNTYQNYNEISTCMSQNGCYPKDKK